MASEVHPLLARSTVIESADVDGFPVSRLGDDSFSVVVCQTGIGSSAAQATAAVLDRYSPAAAVSIGIAGGISPGLRAGDVILCDHLCICEHSATAMPCESLTSDTVLLATARQALEDAGVSASTGSTLTVPEIISTPEHKRRLREASGHDIVEMESYWVAKAADAQGIPSLAVRVVSDQANDTLILLGGAVRPDGTLDYAQLAAWTREHPDQVEALGTMAERWRVSSETMARVAEALLRPLVWSGFLAQAPRRVSP